ncbi:glycoside hydrolase family 38 C-terminal domain-containing protein [Alkalihalobacillus macyae]|uniref:glycoside hydrolase family 38 N-terminal domain-containing protein n=1 Tax=Guptibacillus hwajinpoensis TaxID=208199 RepID=UPI00273BE0A2|nr:glycoside hydrolase family 38 C-terminal domain-containing protein [Alkalihalobacillus macyae]MDP4549632.1 glycoside hydrolase family 38 C-terminal domain-containing protein [Alkalihalobacillus macyae]
MKQKKVYVVPHSHWDREWYFTIEDSNLLLVENMDRLMDVMDTDPEYKGYVFDAQSSIIDEYLSIRPEEKDRLSSLIKDKRIYVGPWYTQADSLLVNKESLVRNLLYGTRIAEEMGHSLNVGYLPDIFGQNTYLPSIFKEFGIDYSILQRGIYTDQLNGDLNFTWKSPDGESVKANNIYYGYGPGKFLSSDDDYMEDRLLPILDKIATMNKSTDNLLLPSGGDQVLIREHFPETVKALNEKDDKHEYVLSDYETFMEETFAEADFTNEIQGELIATQKSRIHNTIRSQRYDIKKLNDMAEKKIINELEPLGSMASKLGFKYPKAWLDQMWKMLFDVHAHDSIGGCNSDDTNQEIVNRLTKVIRMADGCMNLLKKQMTEAVSRTLGKDSILVLFHLLPSLFEGSQKAVLFTRDKDFSIKDLNGKAVHFDNLNQEYISGGKTIVVTAEGEKQVEAPGYYRSEVLLHDLALPSMGYKTYEVVVGEEAAMQTNEEAQNNEIENEHFSISEENGSLQLSIKSNDQTIANFLRFENVADAGDSYDFSPLEEDEPIYSSTVKNAQVSRYSSVEVMEVEHSLNVPADLQKRKSGIHSKELVIRSRFELRENEAFIRVTHDINNGVKDHRVRVLMQTSIDQPDHSFGDQGFSFIKRPTINPYMENWKEQKFAEAPVPIYPLENIAGATDGKLTAAVITKGIKEYQLLKETGEFALTLFRSVGLLGKDDLAWRPGRASGINNKVVYTPEAQMQGEMTFEYAITFSEGYNESSLFQLVNEFNDHAVNYQKQTLNTFEERLDRFEIPYPVDALASEFSLLNVSNENVFFSSMKQAYDDESIILRVFNPTSEVQNVAITSDYITSIVQTTLNEKNGNAIEEHVTVRAKGYVTLNIKVDVQ